MQYQNWNQPKYNMVFKQSYITKSYYLYTSKMIESRLCKSLHSQTAAETYNSNHTQNQYVTESNTLNQWATFNIVKNYPSKLVDTTTIVNNIRFQQKFRFTGRCTTYNTSMSYAENCVKVVQTTSQILNKCSVKILQREILSNT